MGDRANVGIRGSDGNIIFLYLHWGGTDINEITAKAIAHAMARDGDESYFTRIFISRVIDTDWNKETGVGMAVNKLPAGGDGYTVPIYDYETQTIGMYKEVWDEKSVEAGEVVEHTKLEYPRDLYLSQYAIVGVGAYV
jgi:hypothetical protein